jgi:hypothetical protein
LKETSKKDAGGFTDFIFIWTEKTSLHCVSLKKYGKNKAKLVLLVRADGMICELMIIFKGIPSKKIY